MAELGSVGCVATYKNITELQFRFTHQDNKNLSELTNKWSRALSKYFRIRLAQ